MKQLLGFPHLHSAAQHSRHEDMKMPTSLSEGLSLLSFLCVIPILPQLLPSPPVQRASGCQREMSRVTCASSCECHCCSITHHTQVLQSSSMRPSPGAGHSCPLWRAGRGWLRHGAKSMGIAVHTPSLEERYTSLTQHHMVGMCACPLEHTDSSFSSSF